MTSTTSWAAKNKANTHRLRNWTFAWVLTTALLAFGPRLLWDYQAIFTVAALVLNVGVGGGMILANRAHLQGMDEMQQRIFLEAAAITLGVGLVFACAYDLLDSVRLIAFEPKIAHVVIVMSLAFLGAMIAGHRKFQ